MKRYAKPSTAIKPDTQTEMAPPVPLSEISVERLIEDGLQALYREMKNLLTASSKGKLDPASARDLRDHMKLLFELKVQEGDSLKHVTDDQLKEMAKVALNEET